jgi:hypothetical protein
VSRVSVGGVGVAQSNRRAPAAVRRAFKDLDKRSRWRRPGGEGGQGGGLGGRGVCVGGGG